MTNKLNQLVKENMTTLPKELQEVVNNFGWEKISEEIGKKYSLSEEIINSLQAEIALVLLGITSQIFLALNIENKAGTGKDEAKKISEEVAEKIFKPMFEKLSENIKNSMKTRSIHWQQNLDFILSGGDYTAFIRRVENEKKDELPKINTFNPSKLDDLKNSFTI